MELSERCLHLCSHITTLTGVHSTLLHIPTKAFLSEPFRNDCAYQETACSAVVTHLYGAYEAQRWDGKYIYYCPRGMVFLAAPPNDPGGVMEYCIILGPILLSNSVDDPFDDPLQDPASLADVPRMTTAQARSLEELLAAAARSLALDILPPDVDSGRLADMMQKMYDHTEDERPKEYPVESERQLQEYIRAGDKEAAQQLLNELLVHIYHRAGSDPAAIKARVRELLVLMNRATIDGGADADEVFALCARYDREVDSFRNFEDLNRWIGTILHQFINFVFDFNTIRHQNVVFKTTAYIKENLADKLTLDKAAEQVYLSKSYFCRILREELGCTFTEYVNRLRIEKSKSLLRGTELSISEIACAVGFGDQSYFTRIFKKQTGMAPGKYRVRKG